MSSNLLHVICLVFAFAFFLCFCLWFGPLFEYGGLWAGPLFEFDCLWVHTLFEFECFSVGPLF